jgi:hypothetical protein
VPVDHWYDLIGNPTLADAILDRLGHSAYRIELSGENCESSANTIQRITARQKGAIQSNDLGSIDWPLQIGTLAEHEIGMGGRLQPSTQKGRSLGV